MHDRRQDVAADAISAREEAEDDAMAALAQLPIADAMEGTVRLQAAMLAGLGIVPGTPEFRAHRHRLAGAARRENRSNAQRHARNSTLESKDHASNSEQRL